MDTSIVAHINTLIAFALAHKPKPAVKFAGLCRVALDGQAWALERLQPVIDHLVAFGVDPPGVLLMGKRLLDVMRDTDWRGPPEFRTTWSGSGRIVGFNANTGWDHAKSVARGAGGSMIGLYHAPVGDFAAHLRAEGYQVGEVDHDPSDPYNLPMVVTTATIDDLIREVDRRYVGANRCVPEHTSVVLVPLATVVAIIYHPTRWQ